jgi:hypothetical protein
VDSLDQSTSITMGYGGLLLGIHPFSNHVIHLYIENLIGVGGIQDINQNFSHSMMSPNPFFIDESKIGIALHIANHMRFITEASYRFTAGLSESSTLASDASIDDWSGTIGLQFGFWK